MTWAAVVGAGIGLIGSQMNSGGSTVMNQVPYELQGLLGSVGYRGDQMGNLPFTPLPFNPTAGFNPYQFAGMDQIMGRAQAPNGVLTGAENSLSQTLGGNFLDSNPFLDNVVARSMDQAQNRMTTGAMSSGSFGNANVAEAGARGIADAGNQVRYQNYSDERNRMMQGLTQAPQIYGLGYAPGREMLGVGGQMQGQAQSELGAGFNEFMRAQQWPFQTWQAMLAPFGQQMGNVQTSTGPRQDPLSAAAGGGLMGGQLWRMYNQGNSGGQPSNFNLWDYNQWADERQ